jgi:hypothetical protein
MSHRLRIGLLPIAIIIVSSLVPAGYLWAGILLPGAFLIGTIGVFIPVSVADETLAVMIVLTAPLIWCVFVFLAASAWLRWPPERQQSIFAAPDSR